MTDEAMRRQPDLPAKHSDETADAQAGERGELFEIEGFGKMASIWVSARRIPGLVPANDASPSAPDASSMNRLFLAGGNDAAS
jgi:hypothetical protein